MTPSDARRLLRVVNAAHAVMQAEKSAWLSQEKRELRAALEDEDVAGFDLAGLVGGDGAARQDAPVATQDGLVPPDLTDRGPCAAPSAPANEKHSDGSCQCCWNENLSPDVADVSLPASPITPGPPKPAEDGPALGGAPCRLCGCAEAEHDGPMFWHDYERVSSGVHNVRPDGAQPWTEACPPDARQCETGSQAPFESASACSERRDDPGVTAGETADPLGREDYCGFAMELMRSHTIKRDFPGKR